LDDRLSQLSLFRMALPNLVLHENPARDFSCAFGQDLGKEHGRPRAILIASAHFDMTVPSFSADENPGMLYDFNGFEERALCKVYPALAPPQLAAGCRDTACAIGVPRTENCRPRLRSWGLGSISQLYPEADIPVVADGDFGQCGCPVII